MNSITKTLLLSGASQDAVHILLFRLSRTCQYHQQSSIKPAVVSHRHSKETQDDGSKTVEASACEESNGSANTDLLCETTIQISKGTVKAFCHSSGPSGCKPPRKDHIAPDRFPRKAAPPSTSPALPQPLPGASLSSSASVSSSDEPTGPDAGRTDSSRRSPGPGGHHWEVPEGGQPPISWDPDVAAHCERSTLLAAPLPLPAVPERARQAEPAADAELRHLCRTGRLPAALRRAAALSAAGTPPPFATLALLADEAARRADPSAFERARRLAARLYPVNYGRAARLRDSQLELLWRRRLFAPACSLLMRYRAQPIRGQLMARRFAVCCCLAAHEGVEDALPHIQRSAAVLMDGGVSGPLLSAWQHCMLSEQPSFQEAGRQLLLRQPAARRQLTPHLLHVLEEAQLAGREDVLRRLLELVLGLGETRLYPLVFGALLDFQCLMEDVRSARETFKLVGELSISLPSTVINRYSSLLQRHRLKAPAALLRMKYRQRPPDNAAAPKVPSAPDWFDKW